MPALGDEFRAAREARHLSLSDVSEQIHIRSVYLQSIEDEDWSAVAAPVYVRGFVRTYARFLGLDPEAAVEHFNDSIGAMAAKPHDTIPVGPIEGRRRPSPWLWLAAAAALILVAFVGYRYLEFQQDGGTTTVAAVSSAGSAGLASAQPSAGPSAFTSPAASAPPSPAAVATSAAMLKPTLELSLTAPSWVLVTVDGSPVLQTTLAAGTHKWFHGEHVDVRAGNAGGVHLRLNGKDLGPMGDSGAVVERSLSLAAAH